MVSRCCKKDVFILIDYYQCSACHFPCVIVSGRNYCKENLNESRYEGKIEDDFN
jgi:hypothetical protein